LPFEIDSEGDAKMDDAAMRNAAPGASSSPSLPVSAMAGHPSSTSTGPVNFKFSPASVPTTPSRAVSYTAPIGPWPPFMPIPSPKASTDKLVQDNINLQSRVASLHKEMRDQTDWEIEAHNDMAKLRNEVVAAQRSEKGAAIEVARLKAELRSIKSWNE
jgi:hypothetical protein